MDLFRRLFTQTPANAEPAKPVINNVQSQSAVDTPPSGTPIVETAPISAPPEETTASLVPDGATRPLPPETVISSSNEHLAFGQATDVGMIRTNNQDSMVSFLATGRSAEQRPDFGLFIVADGMGGHHDGEKASAMSSRIVAAYVTQHIYLPMLNGDNDSDRVPVTEAMIAAVQKANGDVIIKVPDGGTTLTAVAVIGDLAYVAHVGDTRVYLIAKDGIEQITRDHSLVQRLIELGQLTPEEAAMHPQKNVLYRALGQSDNLEVDALTRRLPPNSKLLICSDGLWNMVTESEIVDITMKHSNPQEACDKMVALANTHGGVDNITAVLLQIPTN